MPYWQFALAFSMVIPESYALGKIVTNWHRVSPWLNRVAKATLGPSW